MNFCTPTFKNISDTEYSVQDIVLSGMVTDFVDELSILDETGNVKEGTSCRWLTGVGWVDSTTTEFKTMTIKPGEGIMIYTMLDDVIVTFSGEVSKSEVQLLSLSGMNFVGNATPVEIDVQTITLGANVTDFVDELSILDETGNVKEGTSCRWLTGVGWVDSTTTEFKTLPINPGEGVMIYTMMDNVEIILPGAKID